MSWRLKKNLPELLGLLERDRDGHFHVYVWCPYCAKWHNHSWDAGSNRRAVAHRVAHCFKEDSPFKQTGYFIRIDSRVALAKLAKRASETDALALARAREGEVTR